MKTLTIAIIAAIVGGYALSFTPFYPFIDRISGMENTAYYLNNYGPR